MKRAREDDWSSREDGNKKGKQAPSGKGKSNRWEEHDEEEKDEEDVQERAEQKVWAASDGAPPIEQDNTGMEDVVDDVRRFLGWEK